MAPQSEPDQLNGRAHPPGRSVAVGMQLRRSGDRVQLFDGAGELWVEVDLNDTRRDAPLGRLPRKITFRDGTIFETAEVDAFDAMFGRSDGHALHASEAFRPRLIAMVVGCIIGAVLIWLYALPAMVKVAVWATPEVMLEQMDAGSVATFDQLVLAPSTLSETRQAEIAAMFDDLADQVPPGDLPRRNLLFRGEQSDPSRLVGSLGPNAFALPGGTIVVTDALAKMLDDDPDALAGILAHELTHVTEQHGLHALYRSIAIYVVIALLAGDTGPILDEVLLEGNVLLSLRGSREAEREADAGAVRLMQAADYDPEGLARFFDRLNGIVGEGGGWMSTHPGNTERADRIRELSR